ncbi:MAG: matrixin family metalloprotease, partial [Acidobacteriota bacterium]|nr:matrixin family metalloprotease [Acidobacteriota bacterium]
CAGMLTASGVVAQYANLIHGWDLGSDGAAHLGYIFGSLTTAVSAATVQSEIVRAFSEWAKHTNVIFSPGSGPTASRTVLVKFVSGAHGDAYPFDGPGGTLAHTFYPVPVNPESIAGDMHLDADEKWRAGSDIDIYSVALHEAGHALGLGHSDKPGDVMYPYYRRGMSLSVNDIGAVQALYGKVSGGVSAPIAAPAPLPAPSTPSSPPTPLTLTLDTAPAAVETPAVTLTGTIAGGIAPYTIQWLTDNGYSGKAMQNSPGNSWSTGPVPLVNGPNTVSISAFDAARSAATRTAAIAFSPAAASPASGTPGGPISVSITAPALKVTTINAASTSLAGSASGGSGITKVTWQTAAGASGTATGTARWLASSIPLFKGTNTIVVRAYDASGGSGWTSLVAVRNY